MAENESVAPEDNENPPAIITDSHEANHSQIQDLQCLKQLAEQHHEARLAFTLNEQIIAVQFTPPNVTFHALHDLPDNFNQNLIKFINKITGENWQIHWQKEKPEGLLSLAQFAQKQQQQVKDNLQETDFLKQALHLFPDAEIINVESLTDEQN